MSVTVKDKEMVHELEKSPGTDTHTQFPCRRRWQQDPGQDRRDKTKSLLCWSWMEKWTDVFAKDVNPEEMRAENLVIIV